MGRDLTVIDFISLWLEVNEEEEYKYEYLKQ